MGHVSRCIPIIAHLLSTGCKVIVAADPGHFNLLRTEFPDLQLEPLPGYRLRFGTRRITTILRIILQVPAIVGSIRREQRWLKSFISKHAPDAVLSDNRYGLYHRQVPSVFITHQLLIKTPFGPLADRLLQWLNYRLIGRFRHCWVPDFAGSENLGGLLSHPAKQPPIPVHYLGRLTRFQPPGPPPRDFALLIILSGPEPQRTIFENILLKQLRHLHKPAVLVRGLPGTAKMLRPDLPGLTVFNHLSADLLSQQVNDASVIISRPGYSTVMDLVGRGRKPVFVATPGQTEQEYLATYLSSKKLCILMEQEDFDLANALSSVDELESSPYPRVESGVFSAVVDSFLASLK